ncbi:MAG TPA: TIGR02265 family protein, partial [Anaeromyxobacteraceae bacterium]|nr:TIGR02265 family protein [Anaeromyxobacteraceae bacterium]
DMQRLLSQAPSGYRATVSYGERAVDWPAPNHCHMVFKHDFLVPPFHCGVVSAAIEMMGGRNVQAAGRQTGFLEAEYDFEWE